MKKWHWWVIGGGSTIFILAFFLIVPIAIMDKSMWWFYAPLIFFGFVGIIVGIVLFINLKKVQPIISKVDMKDAKRRVIHEIKYDEDNPDNFRVDWRLLLKIGKEGGEKTPIGAFFGVGTELNERRIAIVNLNNPKKETSILIDPTEPEIKEAIRVMADNPPDPDVWEETTTKLDLYGKPTTTTRVRRPSGIKDKIKQEEQKAEEVNAL